MCLMGSRCVFKFSEKRLRESDRERADEILVITIFLESFSW
jgi:hypothetical protein